MNDHVGGIIHRDKMRTLYREAEQSRLAASRRSGGFGGRIAGLVGGGVAFAVRLPVRVRIAVVSAAVLALLLGGMAGHVWAASARLVGL